jgi:hypothetical protein
VLQGLDTRLLRLYFLVSVIPIATEAVARRGCVVEGLVNRRVRCISCCVYSDISLVADFNVYPYIIRLDSEVNIPVSQTWRNVTTAPLRFSV